MMRVVTAAGQWRAWLPASAAPRAPDAPGSASGPCWPDSASSRGWPHDAVVAGFVPGIALGWSWTDTLRHAVALAAAAKPDGDVDLGRYESLLPDVRIEPSAP
jgi:hypothetical protein